MPGRPRPTTLPFLPPQLAAFILGKLATLSDDQLWWPCPELNARLEYTLINPVTNQRFFNGGPQNSYWLGKWMTEDSYEKYTHHQGRKWPHLPTWVPGNSRTPPFTVHYFLDYKINGKSYPRWL